MTKVAIYCRLSEEDRDKRCELDDSESIQNQKSMLCEYALEHGWNIYNIYSDDDYAGADRRRPQFNKLLEDAKEKKFDIILCKTQSRFTRELELVEKYIHGLFPIWGIRFISIVDNADTANKGNKKSRQINGLINEWYLEDRGIPNQTEYKRLHGLRYKQPKRKNSTLWKYFAISDMLVNEIYIGNMVQGKYGSISYKTKQNKPRPKEEWFIVKGTHDPIIDRELWDKVQTMVQERAKPFVVGTIGLFAGKVKCMHCGYTMRSSKCHGKHYLGCSNRHVSKDSCIGSFISVERLEKAVIDELKKMSDEFLDKENLENNIVLSGALKNQKQNLEKEIALCNKKTAEYSKAIKDLYFDKVKGIITESEYVDFSRDFVSEKKRLETLLRQHQKSMDKINERMTDNNSRQEIIKKYTDIDCLDRETVQKLIDYICIGKRIEGSRDVPIEIHWNF